MVDLRSDLVEALNRLDLIPVDDEVDSALRLLKAFLLIPDTRVRAAFVELAESFSQQ